MYVSPHAWPPIYPSVYRSSLFCRNYSTIYGIHCWLRKHSKTAFSEGCVLYCYRTGCSERQLCHVQYYIQNDFSRENASLWRTMWSSQEILYSEILKKMEVKGPELVRKREGRQYFKKMLPPPVSSYHHKQGGNKFQNGWSCFVCFLLSTFLTTELTTRARLPTSATDGREPINDCFITSRRVTSLTTKMFYRAPWLVSGTSLVPVLWHHDRDVSNQSIVMLPIFLLFI